jgi:hypothetical protein
MVSILTSVISTSVIRRSAIAVLPLHRSREALHAVSIDRDSGLAEGYQPPVALLRSGVRQAPWHLQRRAPAAGWRDSPPPRSVNVPIFPALIPMQPAAWQRYVSDANPIAIAVAFGLIYPALKIFLLMLLTSVAAFAAWPAALQMRPAPAACVTP